MKKGGSGGPSSYVEVTTVVRVLLLQSYKQYPYVHINIYIQYIYLNWLGTYLRRVYMIQVQTKIRMSLSK